MFLRSRVRSDGSHRAMELPVLISRVAIATGESDYDDDKADWQSEKHKPRSRAKGRTFIECVVNEN
jgi:hypothetical protein